WAFYQSYRNKSLKSDRLVRLRGDCTDTGLLKRCLEEYKPDYIIHLAALTIASVSNDFPTEAKVNIFDSTVSILDVLKDVSFKFQRLIYTSSSMIYGNFLRDSNGDIIPATEDQPCNPIDLYGAMKLGGEHVVRAYFHRFKIPYTIIRPSAVYGPTDCNRRVTEIFLTNAIKGKDLVLDNGGKHQLDFTYVEDLVMGYILAVETEKAAGEAFNITRGEGRSILELAEVVAKYGKDVKIVNSDVVPYRPNRGTLDISKARKILGYSPRFSLEEGMEKYYNFINEFEIEGLSNIK
ncbi:NAD-dependent epimerase/dehydratase family protein, partial [candidate division KSB1 bacterium]